MRKRQIRDRLFKVISDYSELQMDIPHTSSRQSDYTPADVKKYNVPDKREHPRKDVPVYGIFETFDSQFRASTKNVSMGGVLIDPETELSFNEYMHMTFFHRKFNFPIRVNGKVVRVGSDGVGIKFDQTVPAMASM